MSENKKYLMEFNPNWADEIDFHSLAVVDELTVQQLNDSRVKWPISMYYGTNEDGDVDTHDFSFRDVPDGLDEIILQETLEHAGVGDLCGRLIDQVYERLSELERDQFAERYFEAFRRILYVDGLVAFNNMLLAIQLHKAYDDIPYSWDEEGRKVRVDAYKKFEAEWHTYEKKYALNQVFGYKDYGEAHYTYTLARNLLLGMYEIVKRHEEAEEMKGHSMMWKYMKADMERGKAPEPEETFIDKLASVRKGYDKDLFTPKEL